MKVVGISFRTDPIQGSGSPIHDGYIPIENFTGILGPNDSGKSSLLALVEEVLNGSASRESVIFASCGQEEFAAITGYVTTDLIDLEKEIFSLEEHHVVKGARDSWWPDPYVLNVQDLEKPLDSEVGPVEAWRDRLLETYKGPSDAWAGALRLVTEGSDSNEGEPQHLLGFEPSKVTKGEYGGTTSGWNVLWCCPPRSDLKDADRKAIDELRAESPPRVINRDGSALDADDPRRVKADQIWAPSHNESVRMSGFRYLSNGARDMPNAPIVIAPVGRSSLPLLPRPIMPRDSSAVNREIERSVGEAIGEIRWARFLSEIPLDNWDAAVKRLTEFVADSFFEHPPTDIDELVLLRKSEILDYPWIVGNTKHGWRMNEELSPVLRRIERDAEARMPPSFGERYRLLLRTVGPDSWPATKIKLRVAARDKNLLGRDGYGDSSADIPFDDLAEGLKLWVQIALLEALAPLEKATRILSVGSTYLYESVIADWIGGLDDGELWEETAEMQTNAQENLDELFSLDREIEIDSDDGLGFLERARTLVTHKDNAEIARGRLLLVDEPERFLHPRLQRQMASWIESSGLANTQVVVATHSAAFLNMNGEAAYVYLVREPPSPTQILPITTGSLDEMGYAATELGLDRGELLSLVNLILWVEGRMDRVVLEELFGSDLRKQGIVVIEMQGHSKSKAILETSLMKFTTARTAVWLDKIDAEFASRLLREPSFAEDQLNGKIDPGSEEATLARIAIAAHDPLGANPRIHPIGLEHPGNDIFDLFDEESVVSVYPEYPGHARAQELWEKAVAQGKNRRERKQFWEKRFKTPITETSCRSIAAEMRQSGRVPESLRSVFAQCESLATQNLRHD